MRKSLILLGILDDSDINWMLRFGIKQHVLPGQVIIREGELLDAIFIILAGRLKVSFLGRSIAELASGEIVGEMSLVDARPPSATVSGLEPSWVLAIPLEELDRRLSEDSVFAARFYRAIAVFLSTRLRVTVSTLGYGKHDDNLTDEDEIPMHLMEDLSMAAKRFTSLQERSRSSGT